MHNKEAVFESEYTGELLVQRAQSSRQHSMTRVHYHNNYEIYCLISGKRRYFVEDSVYNLTAGDILFVPKGTLHKTAQSDNCLYNRLLICFGDGFLPAEFLPAAEKCFEIKYFHNDKETVAEAGRIIGNIEKEYAAGDEYTLTNIKSLLFTLFTVLLRAYRKTEPEEYGKIEHITKIAMQYIGDNYGNDISLDTVGEKCGVSREHLSRSFKKYTGFGFQDYVTQIRLLNAEKLLTGTELTVAEIAMTCGYNDSNYFSAVFHKNRGISPKEFRKSRKSGQ